MNLDHYTSAEDRSAPGDEREAMRATCLSFTQLYHELREQTLGRTRWLGRSVVKSPMDLLMLQEIIAETRPNLIVETGVLAGGTTYYLASLLDLLEIDGRVIGIDIDLRGAGSHIAEHPKIELIEGSSIDPEIVAAVAAEAEGRRVMVDLDADHSADHVARELEMLAPLVSPGCYLVVEDTWIGRSVREEWAPGPGEALDEWLGRGQPFEVDRWRERFLLSHNSGGYLRRNTTAGDAASAGPPRLDGFFSPELERPAGPSEDQRLEIEQLRRRCAELEAEVRRLVSTRDEQP